MKDFTLRSYRRYLHAIRSSFSTILRFDEFLFSDSKPDSFCLIRHDVDRKPNNSLKMAEVEAELGIRATYYFRAKPNVFNVPVIREIESMGHEIGYHYESLSDYNGDMFLALKGFMHNLNKFREVVPIRTISMHGAPLSPFDNRDIWREPKNHALLINELGILGEIYLDIDYSDIVYINDTGRNWFSSKSNIRDHVATRLNLDFKNGDELYNYLAVSADPRLVFQIHPERWSDHISDYYLNYFTDHIVNSAKYMLMLWGRDR
ncbi:conserved hypothetical protein [uncultured Desulfobacterium sp.]|uniref:Polysaccharide deacetylase n=1 Tax=uncultured Desulfobacterium sp. TaxID=201089 RepID=A0A445MXB1_9BACT|nr:conserved hypothetical protein [uncultured Desulfobacterium sp.]